VDCLDMNIPSISRAMYNVINDNRDKYVHKWKQK